jgi:hypothetical protein
MTSIKNYNNFKVKCKLEVFDEITDWKFNRIDKSNADKLIVGDIVRIMAKEDVCYEKYYVEIIKIDRYKYGGIYKPRKFYGKIIDIYILEWSFLNEGDLVTFRKENICEIPNWKGDNPILQPNLNNIMSYIKRKDKIDWIR